MAHQRHRSSPIPEALAAMEERVAAIRDHDAAELVWLLEHPPLYTAGTSAAPDELLVPDRFPVYAAGPRRPLHLSRAGPAHRLCDARPQAARRRHPALCPSSSRSWRSARSRGFGVQGERRAGPDRDLGRRCPTGGGQDRRHRRARAPLGQLPWPRDQPGARPQSLSRASSPAASASMVSLRSQALGIAASTARISTRRCGASFADLFEKD